MRRAAINAVSTGAVLAAIAGGVAAATVGSDARAAHLVTAARVPAALQPAPLPASVSVRWAEPSTPPGEIAADDTTVVVASEHGLSGRDPQTAAERWFYRRSNAILCAWTVRDHTVVAAFRQGNGCRELIGLDSGTGTWKWARAVDLSSPVDLVSAEGVAIFRSGDRLQAVDTGGGLNRWTSWQPGCTWGPVRVNTLAAVGTLTCGDTVRIVSHDAYAETEHWRAVAPAADAVVVAVGDPTAVLSDLGGRPTLTGYDERGQVRWTLSDPRFASTGRPDGLAVDGQVLLWTGTAVVTVDSLSRSVRWQDPALGLPRLDGDGVLLSEPAGFVQRQLGSGRPLRQTAVARDAGGTDLAVARTGPYAVVTSPAGVTVYG